MTSSPNSPSSSSGPRRRIRVVACALVENAKVLIVRRPEGEVGAGGWEFPGGKIEPGESPGQALVREIEEELGVIVGVDADLGWIHHAYENVDIDLNLMICHRRDGDIVLHEHDAMEWVEPAKLEAEKLLAADRPFVQTLRDHVSRRNR